MLGVSIRTEPVFTAGIPEVLFEDDTVILGSEARNYDVSGDGTRFLVLKPVETQEGSAENREVIIVEEWFEELKRAAPPASN